MKVRFTRLRPDVEIPAYKTPGSAAFDLASTEDLEIAPGGLALAPTGLVIATPPGHVLYLTPRSSLFKKKGLVLANGIGIIDSDYCGPSDEIKLVLMNPGAQAVRVEKGERLVQGTILPILRAEFEEGPAESPDRGGIGSTGGYA
ncbi:MAG: dUTP diphosphatase [Patescibacteria group bacterium]